MVIVTAAVFSFYASARSLQIGTILAGLAVFGDRLGNDALIVAVRLAAFALILTGAALIPAPVRAGVSPRRPKGAGAVSPERA